MFIRVSIAVPEELISDANQLARVVGYSELDGETFGSPNAEDADGNLYAFASGLVKPRFVTDVMNELVEPEWGADMEAAQRAQSLLQVSSTESGEPFPADPERITAVIGWEAPDALEILGLVRL